MLPPYTRAVPTPFYHLQVAAGLPVVLDAPGAHGAFLFGNTAPDVQTLSGAARSATHFFDMPVTQTPRAVLSLLQAHPQLAALGLFPAQRAFVAGYLAHLALDELWLREIFQPVFGPEAGWETFGERLFLHNVLRTYLDERDRPTLPAGTAALLAAAEPAGWLPFASDTDLCSWRNFLVQQLQPGAPAQTVAVFAQRMGRTPQEFEALLGSPAELQARIFSRISEAQLNSFHSRAASLCKQVVDNFLQPPAAGNQ